MKSSKFQSLRRTLVGLPPNPTAMNPRKHPVLSGAVPVVQYVAPAWRYGNRSSNSINAN